MNYNEDIYEILFCEKEKGKVNQLDVGNENEFSLHRDIWFSFVHLLPQSAFYVTVFNLFVIIFLEKE